MKTDALRKLIYTLPNVAKMAEKLYPHRNKIGATSNLHAKIKGDDKRHLTDEEEAFLVKELQEYALNVLKQFPVKTTSRDETELLMKALR